MQSRRLQMLKRIVLAVVVGVVVFLGCLLLGLLLNALTVSFAVTIGAFLTQWAGVIGLLAAIWHFFSGGFVIKA
jgi:hypothetical protein